MDPDILRMSGSVAVLCVDVCVNAQQIRVGIIVLIENRMAVRQSHRSHLIARF